MKKNLVMLAIMDGYGINSNLNGNAVATANKPNLDKLFKKYPNVLLGASGEDVGLPEGQMGNSEVGHMNIGAGRVVYQSLTRVNIAVRNQELEKVEAINEAIEKAKANNSKLHIMGLLSDGGVHSHINHILYLLEKCVAAGIKEVVCHAFLDGRDVPPKSAVLYLKQLQDKINEVGHSKIGVVSGRYYAMDRDKNYDRLQYAYNALVYNDAPLKNVFEGIEESYNEGITDEFVKPYIVNIDSNIEDGDSVVFANFRPDRAIEISTALTNPKLTPIKDAKEYKDLTYVCMMLYSENVKGKLAFDVQKLDNIYGDVIGKAGLKQLRIAETEKYAHVTYFFDGGVDKEIINEERILVASPKVATYDMKPEMSAYEVCDKVVEAIRSEEFDTIILNFANCDMVGHTAIDKAVVKAVETVDECVGKIIDWANKNDATLMVTADHGNAEEILTEQNKPMTAHTTNLVPFCINKKGLKLRQDGGTLADIAPTIIHLLNEEKPIEMTGTSLIVK